MVVALRTLPFSPPLKTVKETIVDGGGGGGSGGGGQIGRRDPGVLGRR